jgi:hypothetical protein
VLQKELQEVSGTWDAGWPVLMAVTSTAAEVLAAQYFCIAMPVAGSVSGPISACLQVCLQKNNLL